MNCVHCAKTSISLDIPYSATKTRVHPLRISEYTISKLADAGLYKTVMGIQSGSQRIRSEIFHRRETREDILRASEILSRSGVRQITYDFMLRHPFESEEDIRQTYELCAELERPFELQLHGLSFLPGTDITRIAERNKLAVPISESGPDSPMKTEYKAYWGHKSSNAMINFWYSLIYMSQFSLGFRAARYLSSAPKSRIIIYIALMLSKLLRPAESARKLYKKAAMLATASIRKIGIARAGRQAVQYQ
jgi:anaerobic magnesium-protoporphyrin IX monomethyl ester cyclase